MNMIDVPPAGVLPDAPLAWAAQGWSWRPVQEGCQRNQQVHGSHRCLLHQLTIIAIFVSLSVPLLYEEKSYTDNQ